MQRVIPSPASPVSIDAAYAGPLAGHDERPWVGLCMVASLDGSTAIDGGSSGLSSANDSAVLLRLRAIADVILVGSGTARGEGYGPPSKVGQRIGVITNSGDVDLTSELFTSGAGFVITSASTLIDGDDVDVLRAGTDTVDLREAIRRLPEVCPGATFVQVEGGPTLNGALADADLFDELNINSSPALVGGDGHRIVNGAAPMHRRFELAQMVVDDDGFVFSRWLRRRSPETPSP